jgi:ribosomal protein S18 acetylase RimI-like enzyme
MPPTEIRRMRVDPDHQRNGYGRAPVAGLEDRAREEGFDAAELETTVRQRAARSLYESAGYEEVGRRTVHGMERVVYRREL